jgi:hypothetical protein
MKNLEQFGDLLSMAVGMIGALLKGIKAKFKVQAIVLGMIVAGILTFSVTGLIEMYYNTLSPKLVILISFVVGWMANEITVYLDKFVGDVYGIFIQWLRNKTNTKNNEK